MTVRAGRDLGAGFGDTMIPSAALLPATKPVCHRCRLFIVDRDGAVCEVCRKKIGIERNAVATRAAWARKRAAKEITR